MKAVLLGVVASIAFAQAASAGCVLKRERMADDAKCVGLVGYANGSRVGFFNGHSGGPVTVGGQCASEHARGSMVASNKVNVGGKVWTLSDHCRSSY